MVNKHDEEFHFPSDEKATMEVWHSLEDTIFMEKEYSNSMIDEFSDIKTTSTENDNEKHRWIKKMMLAPIISVIAVTSLVFSALDYDPLGNDLKTVDNEEIDENVSKEKADDAFPVLSNLEPDFAGDYAWSDLGSEEYIRVLEAGESEYKFLLMGSAWESFGTVDNNGEFIPNQLSTIPNAHYDATTNTLTLENFSTSVLDVNLMGNSFTIRLIGENHLDQLTIWGAGYGGSVTITGSGSLSVNENGNALNGIGIYLNSEWSQSCLMIDKDVTLDVYGERAIMVSATSMSKAIYYLKPLQMTGGKRTTGEFFEYFSSQYDENGNYIGNEPITLDDIYKDNGVRYYDYTVIGEDGKPSTHVHFEPAS